MPNDRIRKVIDITANSNFSDVARDVQILNTRLAALEKYAGTFAKSYKTALGAVESDFKSTATTAEQSNKKIQQSAETSAKAVSKAYKETATDITKANIQLANSFESVTDGFEKDINKLNNKIENGLKGSKLTGEFEQIRRNVIQNVQLLSKQLGEKNSELAGNIAESFVNSTSSLAKVLKQIESDFAAGTINSAQAVFKITQVQNKVKSELPGFIQAIKDANAETINLEAGLTTKGIPKFTRVASAAYSAQGIARSIPTKELGLPDLSSLFGNVGTVSTNVDNATEALTKFGEKLADSGIVGDKSFFGSKTIKALELYAKRQGEISKNIALANPDLAGSAISIGQLAAGAAFLAPALLAAAPAILIIAAVGLAIQQLSEQAEKSKQAFLDRLKAEQEYVDFIKGGGTALEGRKKIAKLEEQRSKDQEELNAKEARKKEIIAKAGMFLTQEESDEFDTLNERTKELNNNISKTQGQIKAYGVGLLNNASATNDANAAAQKRIEAISEEVQKQEDLRKIIATGSEEDVKSKLKESASRKKTLEETLSGYREEAKQLEARGQTNTDVYQNLLDNIDKTSGELRTLDKDAKQLSDTLPKVKLNDSGRKYIEQLQNEAQQKIELQNILRTGNLEEAQNTIAQNQAKKTALDELNQSLAEETERKEKLGQDTTALKEAMKENQKQIDDTKKSTELYTAALPGLQAKQAVENRLEAIRKEMDLQKESANLVKTATNEELDAKIKEANANKALLQSRLAELDRLGLTNEKAKQTAKEYRDQIAQEDAQIKLLTGSVRTLVTLRQAEDKALEKIKSAIQTEVDTEDKIRSSSTESVKERLKAIEIERNAIEKRLPGIQALALTNESAAKTAEEYRKKLTELSQEQLIATRVIAPLVKLREDEEKAMETIKNDREKLKDLDKDIADAEQKHIQDNIDKLAEYYKEENKADAEYQKQKDKDLVEFNKSEQKTYLEHLDNIKKIKEEALSQEEDLMIERDFIGLFNLRRSTKKRINEENEQAEKDKEKRAIEFAERQKEDELNFFEQKKARYDAYQERLLQDNIAYQKERGLQLQARNQILQDIANNEAQLINIHRQMANLRQQIAQSEITVFSGTSNAILNILSTLQSGAGATISNILGVVGRLSGLTITQPTIVQPTVTQSSYTTPTAGTAANPSLVYTSSSIGKAGRYLAEGGSMSRAYVNEPLSSSGKEYYQTTDGRMMFPGFGIFEPLKSGYVNANNSNSSVSDQMIQINVTVPPTTDRNIPRLTAAEVKQAVKAVLKES